MTTKTFPVVLHVVTDPETSETWIARDDSYFEDARALALNDLNEQVDRQRLAGADPDELAKADAEARRQVNETVDAQKAEHAEARQGAETQTFWLKRLVFGDTSFAREVAKDRSGVVDADAEALELLCRCLVTGEGSAEIVPRKDILALDPTVGRELTARAYAMAHPDRRRMALFAARPRAAVAAAPQEGN